MKKYSNQILISGLNILHYTDIFQLSELCDVYRLTGISLVSQEARKVCFRCETFYNGKLKVYMYMVIGH